MQNDCKNIYSAEYARNKGTVAEDLRNSELSYPMVIGLITESSSGAIAKALQSQSEKDIEHALSILQSHTLKDICLTALEEARFSVKDLVDVWGRREAMSNNSPKALPDNESNDITSSTSDMETEALIADAYTVFQTLESEVVSSPLPFHTDGTVAKISKSDLDYWKQRCIPMISSLLDSCGVYASEEKTQQLRFLKDFVLPNLGPRPRGEHSQIKSMATFSGFPLQPSINLSGSGMAKLRYTFEPLDAMSGTESDPFALAPAKNMLVMLANHLGVWTGWIEALITAYHPTSDEVEEIRPKLCHYLKETIARTTGQSDFELPPMPRMWVSFIAFDLNGSSQAMKVYFDPKIKEAITGIPSCQYTLRVLRNLKRFENRIAVDMLEQ